MKKLGITIIALLAGGLIYVCWRSESIVMFSWFNYLGIEKPIGALRNITTGYLHLLPSWFLYSLPDALWLFSGFFIFDAIWGQKNAFNKILWLSILWFVAIGIEVGQAFRLVPGTFDFYDVAFMLIASLFALKIIFTTNKESMVSA